MTVNALGKWLKIIPGVMENNGRGVGSITSVGPIVARGISSRPILAIAASQFKGRGTMGEKQRRIFGSEGCGTAYFKYDS